MGRPSKSNTFSGLEGIIISNTNLIHRTLKKTSIKGELISIEQANVMGFVLMSVVWKEAQVLSNSVHRATSQ